MDSEVKRVIDLRLARGEISKAEYDELTKVLLTAAPIIPPSELLVALAEDGLRLFSDHLTIKEHRFSYSDVLELEFTKYKNTANFIPICRHTAVGFRVVNGPRFYAGELTRFSKGKRAPIIETAYAILRDKSAPSRLAYYLQQVRSNQGLQLGGIKVSRNGDIENKDTRLNLRRARLSGSISWGIVRSYGLINFGGRTVETNPYGVTIEEHSPKRRLEFSIQYDYDVIRDVLIMLADGDLNTSRLDCRS